LTHPRASAPAVAAIRNLKKKQPIMKHLHTGSLVLILACAIPAQAADTAMPAATAASMPHDCGMAMKGHDHGADRGTRAPAGAQKAAMSCGGSASAPAAKAKSKPVHDHTKMHKAQ
jgi:hypothetical protein